jgi:hypothetical protein
MTSIGSADIRSAPVGALAMVAYAFVRAQFDIVSALARLLRNGSRGSAMPEEEQW